MRKWFVLAILLLAVPAWAATRYVDGGIANCIGSYNPSTRACSGGTDTSHQTIASGITNMVAGDTLDIRAGTYAEFLGGYSYTWPGSTSWGAATTIRGHASETITLQPSGTGTVIQLTGTAAKYIIFDNLVLDGVNAGATGLAFRVGSDAGGNPATYIKVSNSEVKNSGKSGVYIGKGSNGCWLSNVKIHNNGADLVLDHGIYASGNDTLIELCDIYSNSGYGVQLQGYDTSNINTGNIVRRNKIHGNGQGIYIARNTGALIYNNLIYSSTNAAASGTVQCRYTATSNRIYNNTIADNSAGYAFYTANDAGSNIFWNNIIYSNTNQIYDGGTGGASSFSNNLCGSSGTGCTKVGNPQFIGGGDYSLASNSPAIEAGADLSAYFTTDYAGSSRPNGSSFDIGAYEGIVQPTVYFVTKSGNDSNTCTQAKSISTAKLTVAGASGGLSCLVAGDVLDIGAGTYAERIGMNASYPSGTSDSARTVIRGHAGESVILQPTTATDSVVFVYDKDYVTIQDLILDGTNTTTYMVGRTGGASGSNRSSYITWLRVEARNSPSGIGFGENGNAGDNNNVKWLYCIAHNNGGAGFSLSSSSPATVDHAIAYANGNGGVSVSNSAASAILSNVTVSNSLIYSNTTTYGLYLNYGTGNLAFNNILWGNGDAGSGQARIGASCTSCRVLNNTVVSGTGYGIRIETGASSSFVQNNIAYGNSGANLSDAGTGTTKDHNECNSGCDVNSDPLFVDGTNHVYRVLNTSPAINAGADLSAYLTADYDGKTRPLYGSNYDIGAFEWSPSAGILAASRRFKFK